MSTFSGFSEEDLERIKSGETRPTNGPPQIIDITTNKPLKYAYLSNKNKNRKVELKSITLRKQPSDDAINETAFEKCRLSLKTPSTPPKQDESSGNTDQNENNANTEANNSQDSDTSSNNDVGEDFTKYIMRKESIEAPDIVRGVDMTEDEMASHRGKIEELQLKQKLMEEQNKKRKEMLSKALADRTRQTEEEVLKLEKIKKELQILDGQFSHDVNMLRKKIDHACLSYSEAEKTYLKVEKEFLQAKIHLQKEKEKKELLTEHLCALITHNETRKAQKLETLMLELASNKKIDSVSSNSVNDATNNDNTNAVSNDDKEEYSIVVDGVDERTGKMVELNMDS